MATPNQGNPRAEALGLWTLTALVVGNMIGSGVFLLPASLAPYGGASFLGWVVTAGGSMAIGLVFARLARRMPAAGGPYAYTREAFGDFAGFLVGWGYWISSWSAVAAIAVAMVGYLGALVPAATASPVAAAASIPTVQRPAVTLPPLALAPSTRLFLPGRMPSDRRVDPNAAGPPR